MQKNKETTTNLYLSEIIKNIVQIFFKLIKDYRRLFTAEMQLAAKSLVIILILSLLTVAILTVLWLCLLAILFHYLQAWHWSWVASLLWLCGVNTLILLGIIGGMFRLKANFSFEATRRQLRKL